MWGKNILKELFSQLDGKIKKSEKDMINLVNNKIRDSESKITKMMRCTHPIEDRIVYEEKIIYIHHLPTIYYHEKCSECGFILNRALSDIDKLKLEKTIKECELKKVKEDLKWHKSKEKK